MGILPASVEEQQARETEQFNVIVNNLNATKNEERVQLASNMLYEAELLEAEAAKKREQAYQYAPSMRPPKKGTVATQTSEAAITVATTAEDAVVETKKSGRGGDRRSKTVKSESNAG
jgi:hypothetical protein